MYPKNIRSSEYVKTASARTDAAACPVESAWQPRHAAAVGPWTQRAKVSL